MPDHPSRPPIAPALPELTNTLAFSLTKKTSLLASLRSKHRSSQTQPTTATTTATTKKGFSSLTTTTTTPPLSSIPTPIPKPHQPNQNDDLDSSFRLAPNAGIGQAPPSASGTNGTATARDAETRQLARKILGRNAARQVQEARDARAGSRGVKRRGGGGGAEESESEEELGRSAVGRERARGVRSKLGDGDGLKGGEREGGGGNGAVDVGGRGEGEVVEESAADVESVPRGDDENKPKKKRKKNKGTAKGASGGEGA
ncbi:hypothetical protein B0T18DRAFT_218895 [Schizothecium vesticola]|uniref:Uncharacterized protein n=1 Tax=Schizothecium vesticola TaxID=314040 RepID=A0AA40EK86_9PEZI|nr:hypothetical protein B0T18DRAFT_218895 [Schizothecium vesticola]